MINIAILDDEQIFLDKILHKAKCMAVKSSAKVKITGFTDSEVLLNNVEKYNILLLDIEMRNMNGIELVKKINEQFRDKIKPIIIFVTN